MKSLTIRGYIKSNQSPNQGIPGLRVEAWDRDLLFPDRLGSAITDQQGKFEIKFSDADFKDWFFDRYPDIFFKIYAGETLLKDTRRSTQWNVGIKEMEIYVMPDIFVDYVVEQPPIEVPKTGEKGSTRSIFKATYTPRKTKPGEADAPNTRGLEKGRFIASLNPSPAEIKLLLEKSEGSKKGETPDKLNSALSIISSSIRVNEKINILKHAKQFAQIDLPTLWQFADKLIAKREENVKPGEQGQKERSELAQMRKNVALAKEIFKVVPVGYLHLEKMSFTPAGIERGELVYSLPLAPGEEVNIAHKEWSRTSEEFERLVTDYMEDFSEEGVAEKSEFADAVNTQSQHSEAYNLSVSASGSYGGFSISSSFGYNASDSSSKSQQTSRKHSHDITRKASSRVTKEHKVSFKVASASEVEDQSVRKIVNPFKDKATRVDYYQLIRKWEVNLYRYGMRLTWDLAIPEPGSGLLSKIKEISQLQSELTEEFNLESKLGINFNEISLDPNAVNSSGESVFYGDVALKNGIVLTEIPPILSYDEWIEFYQDFEPGCEEGTLWEYRIYKKIEKVIPENYEVKAPAKLIIYDDYLKSAHSGARCYYHQFKVIPIGGYNKGLFYELLGGTHDWFKDEAYFSQKYTKKSEEGGILWERANNEFNDWIGKSGTIGIEVYIANYNVLSFSILIPIQLKSQIENEWKQKIWNQMYEFKKTEYYENRQNLKDRLAQLEEELGTQDALSLRKKEREEIMKGVLRWMGIQDIEFFPAAVINTTASKTTEDDISSEMDIENALYDTSTGLVKEGNYDAMISQGEMVKFLHQAIEWENMLYFLYPYFWTHPTRWEFKKYLDHPDPQHKAFLKAGSARVVLTIRPGFEHAFLAFKDTGEMDGLPKYPYLSIGEEYRSFAQTNYPGIPPANPVNNYRPLLTRQQQKTWEQMQHIMQLLEEYSYRPFKKQRQAWRQIKTIIQYLEEYYQQHNTYPSQLTQIQLPSELQRDPWGNIFHYESIMEGNMVVDYKLASWGSDNREGGVGEAMDIRSWEEPEKGEYPQSLQQLKDSFAGEEDLSVIDLWGNTYQYKYPGDFGDYDLYSFGADGKLGGEGEDADITSWAEATLIGQWYEYTPTSAMDIAFDEKMPNE